MKNDSYHIEQIKYDIINHLGMYASNGVLPALNIETLFHAKCRNYIDKDFFVSYEIFHNCCTDLIRNKILICPTTQINQTFLTGRSYRLADDFFWETDPIGRYKYIKDILCIPSYTYF